MTTEQAQTVAEIREYANNRVCASLKKGADADVAVNSIYALLQIVDSQAAEVKRLAKECDELQEEISYMCQAEGVIW